MTRYLQSSFSVNMGTTGDRKTYDKNWERTFGKCPTCGHKFGDGPFCPDEFHKDPDEDAKDPA